MSHALMPGTVVHGSRIFITRLPHVTGCNGNTESFSPVCCAAWTSLMGLAGRCWRPKTCSRPCFSRWTLRLCASSRRRVWRTARRNTRSKLHVGRRACCDNSIETSCVCRDDIKSEAESTNRSRARRASKQATSVAPGCRICLVSPIATCRPIAVRTALQAVTDQSVTETCSLLHARLQH